MIHDVDMAQSFFRALALFAVGLLIGCVSAPQPAPAPSRPPQPSPADLASKTVALVVPVGPDMMPFCTGVWIGPDTILTAGHCVDEDEDGNGGLAAYYRYTTQPEVFAGPSYEAMAHPATHSAQVTALDLLHDLAILHTETAPAGHGVAAMRIGDVHVGERVFSMGHPKGLWYTYTSGDVSAIRYEEFGTPDKVLWIQATAPISPGNSGGGLYDENGELVGIASRVLPPSQSAQNLNLFVHVAHAAALAAR